MFRFLIIWIICASTLFAQDNAPKLNFGLLPVDTELSNEIAQNVYTQQLRNLVKYNDDGDALIYRYYYKIKEKYGLLTELEKRTGRIASMDQGDTGSCVGFGTTKALQMTAACDILVRGEPETFKFDFSPNAIYGIIRYDNQGRWDGATGAWASESLKKYGTLHNRIYGNLDLSQATPQNARQWAAQGLPRELMEAAKEHLVLNSALVSTVDEVKAALQNGYGVILCANVSYSSTRDSEGFSKRTPEGWSHCLSAIAYRGAGSGREGYLIGNSWGGPEGTWINGPIYPDDMPFGSFWITPENLSVHLKGRDCYAIAGYSGFKKRPITWQEIFKVGEEINVEDN